MITLIGLMGSYYYTDLLYIYFYSEVLGRKYSMKVTVLGITVMWGFDCMVKLFPQFLHGVNNSGYMNILMLMSGTIYVIFFFGSSVGRRLVAMSVYLIVQAGMDMIGLKLTSLITGSYIMFHTDSKFTLTVIACSSCLITLGTVMFTWLWKAIEQRNGKFEKYQWISMLLPFSQYAILQQTGVRYDLKSEAVPAMVIVGLVLGFLADIYMFWLFERLNKRNLAKEKLMKLKYQYEMEQLRYEQLKERQEEVAKLRHDFQNYILTMKHMVKE